MESNREEDEPRTQGETVYEEQDEDLDLSDLRDAPVNEEPLKSRLERAARRGTDRLKKPDNWHDTPVNVTDSGRHEIVEEEDEEEDIDLDDVTLDHGAVDGPDLDEGTLNASNDSKPEPEVDASFPGPATIIEEDLDREGIAKAEEMTAGPMTMAGFELADSDDEDERDSSNDTDLPGIHVRDILPKGDAEGSGPMTLAAGEMERSELPGDDDTADDAKAGEYELKGASMRDPDDLGGSGPMTLAAGEMEMSAPEVLDDSPQSVGSQGDKESTEGEIPSGETSEGLIDNVAHRSDDELSAAPPAAHKPAEAGSERAPEEPKEEVVSSVPPVDANESTPMSENENNEDELDLNAANSGDETESDELDLGASGGGEEDSPAETPEDVGGEEAGAVPAEAAPAEPSEEISQQPEVSTVGDDSGAPLGRGLDVGTANLVASRMDEEGGIEFFPARNAFLDVPEDPYTLKMLKGQGVPYIKRENKLFIIGEDAFELANIFNREMRRPMKHGLISPTDVDAMPMEVELFKKILGPARTDGEMVYYSVPADPIDSTMNIVYHTNIVNGLLERLGYRGTPFNEGQAVIFSELGDDDFTGIGISCGGGMVNVCVGFRSMPVISFSTSKGGDWIDQQAAQVMGCAASKITAIKERGVDINAPKTPEEEAIVIYYRHLIKYSLDNIIKKFESTKDIPNFPKPVPIAVSGGTSKVGGFTEVFKDEFSKLADRFPIKISDIRRAEDQLNATSKGCLLAALSHED